MDDFRVGDVVYPADVEGNFLSFFFESAEVVNVDNDGNLDLVDNVDKKSIWHSIPPNLVEKRKKPAENSDRQTK